ncbi:MAG: hypothetical protein VB082_02570 [Christensenella sp.]|nr:hypothetical protein [Christensenella sp.]
MEDIIKRITEEVYKNLSAMQASPAAPVSAPAAQIQSGAYELVRMEPNGTVAQVKEACDIASTKGYAAVCIPQWYVNLAVEKIGGKCKVDTIISLPGGTTSTYAKYAEVYEAIKNGANEVIIPVNMDLLKAGKMSEARNDLATAMISAGMQPGICVKALVEANVVPEDILKQAIGMICDCGIKNIVVSFVLSGTKADLGLIGQLAASTAGKAEISVLGGSLQGLPQGAVRVMASSIT